MNGPSHLTLDRDQLDRLYPAHVLLDERLVIVGAGPAIVRRHRDPIVGTHLSDHFTWSGGNSAEHFALCARENLPFQLRPAGNAPILYGSVIQAGRHFLLAMNYLPAVPTLKESGLQISDFAPSDPMLPALMLAGMQQALLEESRENALELARERQRSEELLTRISRVSGFMAHDFNNILSILSLNAERMAKVGHLNEQQRRLHGANGEVLARGSDLTRSLMTLAQQKHDWREHLDIDALIEENLDLFSTIAGSKIALQLHLAGAGMAVEASRSGLLNCLINLLINARDAMPGGGCVSISTNVTPARSASGQTMTIAVSDTGSGMAPEVVQRAFEPLFSTKRTGNGIGLASVAEFARESGGRATIRSEPGSGAVVQLELPCSTPANLDKPMPVSTHETASAHQKRILVVEDEPYALEALCDTLADQGFLVTGASSAQEALDALGEGGIDLLLTDVVMPDIDGLELARQASARQPSLPVIFMSGYVPPDSEMKREWLFIRKPLDTRQLSRMMTAVFEGTATRL